MRLSLQEITKKYDQKEVFKGASFDFEKGKIYGLLGRNGAGKTTLFKTLMKDIKIDSGLFHLINDQDLPIDYNSDDFGLVLDQANLPEFLTGYEFIEFYLDVNKHLIDKPLSISEYFQKIDFKAEDYDRLIKEYSHGMKNKIQILLCLISKPKVILLDEPLTSFDIVVAMEIKDMIRKMKEDHIIILSTHILELAKELSDEIVILNNGVLRKFDKNLTEDEVKREFLGSD